MDFKAILKVNVVAPPAAKSAKAAISVLRTEDAVQMLPIGAAGER